MSFLVALLGLAGSSGPPAARAAGMLRADPVTLQGSGMGVFLTITVVDAGGAPVIGAAVSASDGDAPPTTEARTTDAVGRVILTNFRSGDVVTVTAVSAGQSATATTPVLENSELILRLGAAPPPATTPSEVPSAPAATEVPPAPVATLAPGAGETPSATSPASPGLASLRLITVDGTGTAVPGAGYRVGLPDGSNRWADDGDDGLADGVTTVWGLPAGSLVSVVATVVPAGHGAPLEAMVILSGNVAADTLTLVALATGAGGGTGPATAVATGQATSPPGEGSRVALALLTCPNDALGGETHYTAGVVTGPATCPPAAATFTFTGPAGTFTFATGADGATTATLPAGTYAVALRLAGTGADHGAPGSITVDGFSEAILTAVAYLATGAPTATPTGGMPGTGSLALTILTCPPARQEALAEFTAGSPGEAMGDLLRAVPGCVARGARLVVIPFGDTSLEPIAVTVDATGRADVGDLPATGERAPHTLVEKETTRGDTVDFEIAAGMATGVIVRFYAGGAGAGSPVPGGDGTGGIPGGGSGSGDGTGGYSSRPLSGPGDALPAAGTGSGGDGGGGGGSLTSLGGGELALLGVLLALALAATMSAVRWWRRPDPSA